MNQVFAVQYTDALYFKKGELKSERPRRYIAIGKTIQKENYLIVYFSEKINGAPLRGLLLPKESIILRSASIQNNGQTFSYPKRNSEIGIYWSDVVYFENGRIPDSPTNMYTEGILIKEDVNSVTIRWPKTIKIKGSDSENHPGNIEPESCIIPKSLINSIEVYENK